MVDAHGLGPCALKRHGGSSPLPGTSCDIIGIQTSTMATTLQKAIDGTITLTIAIPAADIEKAKKEVLESFSKEAQVAGFRKGKAPKKLVEDKVNEDKLREEILRTTLPKAYVAAVTEQKLQPVLNPKIHINKIEEGKDWTFTAVTCEAPKLNLGDYKKRVQDVTAKSKIIVPGKEQTSPSLDDIVSALLSGIDGAIPSVILDQEVDRLLAQTLDEIKTLGISLEQYLSSTNRTVEGIRQEYKKRAENDVKLEFALQQIAEDAKIVIEEKEIDEAIQKAKDKKEQEQMQANRYLLTSILRQQKTFDYLKNL